MYRKLYSNARAEALKELYKSKELDRDRPENVEADFEEVAASCGHLSFSLQTFATEMQTYLTILEELKEVTQHKHRSWNWVRFWRISRAAKSRRQDTDPEQEGLIDQVVEAELPKNAPELVLERRRSRNMHGADQKDSIFKGLSRKILHTVRILERDDGRFGVKPRL